MRAAMIVALVLVAAACGGDDRDEIVVSAAASLGDAFAEIEAEFERANPSLEVVVNLSGSSALREQILAGAPVDVFASANESNMDTVVAAGLVIGEVTEFAQNRLEIAVPPGNPGSVSGLEDFNDPNLLIGLCAPAVPCGQLARLSLDSAGVTPSLDTNEPDVRALLTKIEAGELDAGIVYVSDVVSRGERVLGIAITTEHNATTRYPIAVLRGGANPGGAAIFVDFVTEGPGREILESYGFGLP
jgi:molybdate transport system substrate-binding protein